MTIENGIISGNPRILKSDFNKTYYINETSVDGTLVCTSTSLNFDVYNARLDFTTHETQITSLNIQRNPLLKFVRAIWSPSLKNVIGLIDTFSPEGRLTSSKFVTQIIQSDKEIERSTDWGTYPFFCGLNHNGQKRKVRSEKI
jgi:hypothetical protein